MATVEELVIRIRADTTALQRQLTGATTATQRFARNTRRAFEGLTRVTKGFENNLFRLRTAFLALGAGQVARSIVSASIAFDRIENSLVFATGSLREAGEAMDFVGSQADRLGLPFEQTARQFAQIAAAARGTKLEGEGVRQIFLSVAEASTVLGLSADDTRGALRALQQMISRGRVSLEELSQQLGDRLPGALQLASFAAGLTTQEFTEMVERGEIFAEDFLPRFSRETRRAFADALPRAVDRTVQQINRFQNSLFRLKLEFGRSGFLDAFTDALDDISRMFRNPSFVQSVQNFGRQLGSVLRFMVENKEAILAVMAALTTKLLIPKLELPGLAGAVEEAIATAASTGVGLIVFDELKRAFESPEDALKRVNDQLDTLNRKSGRDALKRLTEIHDEIVKIGGLREADKKQFGDMRIFELLIELEKIMDGPVGQIMKEFKFDPFADFGVGEIGIPLTFEQRLDNLVGLVKEKKEAINEILNPTDPDLPPLLDADFGALGAGASKAAQDFIDDIREGIQDARKPIANLLIDMASLRSVAREFGREIKILGQSFVLFDESPIDLQFGEFEKLLKFLQDQFPDALEDSLDDALSAISEAIGEARVENEALRAELAGNAEEAMRIRVTAELGPKATDDDIKNLVRIRMEAEKLEEAIDFSEEFDSLRKSVSLTNEILAAKLAGNEALVRTLEAEEELGEKNKERLAVLVQLSEITQTLEGQLDELDKDRDFIDDLRDAIKGEQSPFIQLMEQMEDLERIGRDKGLMKILGLGQDELDEIRRFLLDQYPSAVRDSMTAVEQSVSEAIDELRAENKALKQDLLGNEQAAERIRVLAEFSDFDNKPTEEQIALIIRLRKVQEELNEELDRTEKFNERLADDKNRIEFLQLEIEGNKELADELRLRAELEEDFTQAQINRLIELQRRFEDLEEVKREADAIGDAFGDSIGDGIDKVIDGIVELELEFETLRQIAGEVLQDIARQLLRLAIRDTATSAISAGISAVVGGLIGGTTGNTGTGDLPAFSTNRSQFGGRLPFGGSSVVGESGPELLTATRSGAEVRPISVSSRAMANLQPGTSIGPSARMGGGGPTVNQFFDFSRSDSTTVDQLRQESERIKRESVALMRAQVLQGGQMAVDMGKR